MTMELKDKMRGCVSENVMFLQWGELRKGERERSYRAIFMHLTPTILRANLGPGQNEN